MPLQDELRELCTQVGPHVFDDADTFRGAFDDFVPEGAATPGDLRLLVDAIATGAFQRLVGQLELNADPPTAIAAESERLARDRGTVETEGARWALSVLAYARGLTDHGVATRPTALGRPAQPEAAREPSRPTPASAPVAPADLPPTYVPPDAATTATAGTTPPPAPPGAPAPPSTALAPSPAPAPPSGGSGSQPGRKRGLVPIVLAVAVVIAIAVVAGFVLLGGDDEKSGGESTDAQDSAAAGDSPGGEDAGSGGAQLPPAPAELPALPAGSPSTFQFIVRMPTTLHTTVPTAFGEGTGTEIFGGGDPTDPDIQRATGPERTAQRVKALTDQGIPVRVKYYTLRQVGGGEASEQELLDLIDDVDLMAAYWTNVRDLLTGLGSAGGPIELVVEPDAPGEILSQGTADASEIPASVASSGVEGLDGLPDTFAGWAQGWLALRDELAPDVRIGMTVSPWQVGHDLLPEPPAAEDVAAWAMSFGDSYATFGARFDFLDTILTYAEGGSQGPDYQPDATFFDVLLTWVEGISTATDTRVVIDNVPVGNTVYRTLDDNSYHYRDTWAQWILADDTFANLVALRDAGVIGIVFGVDIDPASMTCPCDAAEDGVTNGGDQGKKSASADDDGGYLAERLRAYTSTGGLPL